MTHDISPSSVSFSFFSFLLLGGSAFAKKGGEEGRRTGDLFEILRSCRRCANSHMQTPRELAASIKINTGSVVGAKIKKDEPVLCLVPTRRRTREFQSVICYVFLRLFCFLFPR